MAQAALRNICKEYPGGVLAVDHFNLEIRDKEFVVLVGPSGCGKSTTLRMIAGLEDITEGQLYIGEKLVNNISPKDRDIAMVFQNYALYPHMTVYQNMAFGLKMRRMPKTEIKKRVEETAALLEIDDLLKRKPKALSGGQRQRVALGRAMVRSPAVFLLDEPLSNLDAKLRAQMRLEIIRLHQRLQATFVYVTHDQTEAMTMGDRIVVMKDGRIQQADTPENLYHHPCNQFVAGFIGSPQMNFFTAAVKRAGEGWQLVWQDGQMILPGQRNLTPLEGQQVTAGVRPEDLFICTEQKQGCFFGTVAVAEMIGAETYLTIETGKNRFTMRVPSLGAPKVGQKLCLGVNHDRLHLFHLQTGERLRL